MGDGVPTIKGIFGKIHVPALEKEYGPQALEELRVLYNAPIHFKNSQSIPIKEECRLLECIVSVIGPKDISNEERAIEAGRLHFKNFKNTPLGRILFSTFRRNFKFTVTKSPALASHVFRGVHFRSDDLGKRASRIIMKGADYPPEHFKGFFEEWLIFSGLYGTVDFERRAGRTYIYTIRW